MARSVPVRWRASADRTNSTAAATSPAWPYRPRGTPGVCVGVRLSVSRLSMAGETLYARTQRGSANRARAARRVGRIQAELAQRRAGWIHQVTKQLAAGWERVAVENLNVAGMTRSARGSVENPGRQVRQKAGLNRAILDVSFGEVRRQLAYKTGWYGSRLVVVDRWLPSSKTCSGCGWTHPELTLATRVFRCAQCGQVLDRDLNAARNIAAAAATHDPDRTISTGSRTLVRPKPAAAADDRCCHKLSSSLQ